MTPPVESRTLADLRADPPPPVEELWGRWIVPGELTSPAARGGLGKTTLTRSLMAHGARGGEYLEVPFARPLRWLYFSGEGAASFWLQKMTRAAEAVGLEEEDEARIHVVAAGGDCSLKLNRPVDRDRIRAELDRLVQGPGVDVLCIDPLARFMSGNENSSEDMGAAMDVLLDILREFEVGGWAPHHAGKSGAVDLDALRGHTTFEGAVATAFVLTAFSDDRRELKPVKVRHAAGAGDMRTRYLRFVPEADLYLDEELEEDELSTRQRLERLLGDGEWHKAAEVAERLGVARQTLSDSYLAPAAARGEVELETRERGAKFVRRRGSEEALWPKA